jgi:hypothetical protein
MQIGRRHGIRLYLWLRVWVWEWADRSLTVEGRYYSVHEEERPADHEYIFKLEDADRECPPT